MTAVFLLIFHWFSSLFCQSFYLHRYCSHKMFSMNKFWERFFYLMTYLTQGPSFLNPKAYAILHTQHHQHSDTERDPHSPHHHASLFKMMLKTYGEYKSALSKPNKLQVPTWKSLDNFALSHFNTVLWAIIYLGIYYVLNVELIYYLLLPLHFLVGPTQGAIVNWFGHKVGYRNYQLQDHSVNTLPIDFLLMGELYQNNHHKNGKRLNFAHRFFEVDFTYLLTLPLLAAGIVQKSRSQNEILIDKYASHI